MLDKCILKLYFQHIKTNNMKIVFLSLACIICTFSIAQKIDKTYDLSITKHQLKIGNTLISYTATTGYMAVKDENDSIRAKIFFVAYTKDVDNNSASRPIMFAYNGGPGSASLWLHMGALGPKRVLMNEDGSTLPPP